MEGLMFPKPEKSGPKPPKPLPKSRNPLPRNKKPIKPYSKKRAKAEKARRPMTNGRCWASEKPLDLDKHEIFGGKNRHKSIKWGMVIELNRYWHDMADVDHNFKLILHRWGQMQFERLHPDEDFIKEFGRNYFEIKWEGELSGELLQIIEAKGYSKADFER